MNTKILMTVSAVSLGVAGLILTFLPHESALFLGGEAHNVVALQILGASYFGFAMINWTAKANLIGGIYSRPIAIGNFTHLMIGAVTLSKVLFRGQLGSTMIIITVLYSVFTILFGYVLFNHPSIKIKAEPDEVEIEDFPKA